MIRRLVLISSAAIVGILGIAAPASAHIDPDPSEAQAGSTLTVGFTVEHGCDGSPTVEIDMRLPEGVVDAAPQPLEGWSEWIDDGVVTYTGGPLPADEPATFEIAMTLPATPDTTIYFPFVQHCEAGEIRWIALPDSSGDEPDEPAPALDLFGPAVGGDTSAEPAPVTAATDVPVVTDPADPDVTDAPATVEAAEEDDGSSNIGTVAFIVSVIAVLIVGTIAVVAARRNRPGDDGTTTGRPEA